MKPCILSHIFKYGFRKTEHRLNPSIKPRTLSHISRYGFFMQNDYRNAIRDRIEHYKSTGEVRRLIVWDVQMDEARDPTLLSLRAYGSRAYADVVMVACGVSGIWENLPLKRIALPLPADIAELQRIYLFGK